MTSKKELVISELIRFMLHDAAELDATGYDFSDDVVNDLVNKYANSYNEYCLIWNEIKENEAVKRFYKFFYKFSKINA